MKKKVFRLIIVVWLVVLSLLVVNNKSDIDWMEAQQDNVIETLLEK